MPWEVGLIRALQSLSGGFMDFINISLTYLGDEIFFLVVAVVLFWCVDKKFAFKFMNVYLLSVSAVEGLKNVVARPRPYTVEGVRSIGDKTEGYSFPSGHSHSIANISTQINLRYDGAKERRILLPLGVGLTLIVMFTRLYLGQHYLTDVFTGALLGAGLAILLSRLFDLLKDREEWIFAGVAPICTVVLIIILALGMENAGKVLDVLGAYTAVTLGYFLEKRFIKYEVRSNKWWKYPLKVIIGLALTLALKEGLKFIFSPQQIFLYNYLRYFLVGMFASAGCIYLFKLCRL